MVLWWKKKKPEEAAPVLREYYRSSRVTRSFFSVTPTSPNAAWIAEAPQHPVFLLHANT